MAENSIKVTSNSIGTGNFTINEVVSDVLQSGDVVDLTIINRLEYYDSEYVDYTEWETSECTYLGGFTFSRDVVKSSSANNALVSFSAGAKTIDIDLSLGIELRNLNNIILTSNGSLSIGNTTANVYANSNQIQVANSTYSTIISPLGIATNREILTANVTYYIRTDGDDTSAGLANSAAGAWKTPKHAMEFIWNKIDFNGYRVDLRVNDGTYYAYGEWPYGVFIADGPFYDSSQYYQYMPHGSLYIIGNEASPNNVVLVTNPATWGEAGFWCAYGASYHASGFKVLGNTVAYLEAYTGDETWLGIGNITSNIARVFADVWSAELSLEGPITLTGNAPIFIRVYSGMADMGSKTLTFDNAESTGFAFLCAHDSSTIWAAGCTFVGTYNGKRYNANSMSRIYTNGAGESYLPGNTAGTLSTGAIYV